MTRPVYKAFTGHNFLDIPQMAKLPAAEKKAIEIVSHVLPFKSNNYVVDELIDWDNVPEDPIYTLNFPRREFLKPVHFRRMAKLAEAGAPEAELRLRAREIQLELNPDASGQSANVPSFMGRKLDGVQHKYRETVLFFPMAGQTCHAYCTFCFRWPQFSGLPEARFSSRETGPLAEYLAHRPKVTDLLLTGGDPMVMRSPVLENYLEPFLKIPTLKTIRIGTKSLSYWPYRYLSDPDSDDLMRLFNRIIRLGKNLTVMAHFNHPVELSTQAATEAIGRLCSAGVQIRTQSPVIRRINDKPEVWAEMWRRQVDLGCIPYYMFVERDTGAKHFFSLPLERAWQVFRQAYQKVSGVCRTVRGPIMSATPGKVQILGLTEIRGQKYFVLQFVQGRNPDWVGRPFFAAYDKAATWLSDLKPAFGGDEFFFERELKGLLLPRHDPWHGARPEEPDSPPNQAPALNGANAYA